MAEKVEKQSLSKLYKSSHVRNTVWDILSEDFEETFGRLMKEARNSILIATSKVNKEHLKEMVIEYGYEFENLEHLVKCLNAIKARFGNICEEKDQIEIDAIFKPTMSKDE